MRKQLPLLLTAAAALWLVLCKFVDKLTVGYATTTDQWYLLVLAVMTMVGAVNLTRIHGTNIQRRRSGYYNSILLLVALWVYMAVGIYYGNKHVNYRWVYDCTIAPYEATMFSLIAFFISSAAFRAFRIRTLEGALLGLAAIITMLGNVPIGAVISDQIPVAKTWITNIPNGAGFRAIRIGIYIGTFAACLRIALGLERAHLGAGMQ
jgi:hypothetical protein